MNTGRVRARLGMASVLAIALAGAGCGDGSGLVEIAVGQDACASCRMVFTSTATAAQVVAPGEAAVIFDDLGCLRDYLRANPLAADAAVYVMEHRQRTWIDGRQALFVRATAPTPMASGWLAYADDASRRVDPAGQDAVPVDRTSVLSPSVGVTP